MWGQHLQKTSIYTSMSWQELLTVLIEQIIAEIGKYLTLLHLHNMEINQYVRKEKILIWVPPPPSPAKNSNYLDKNCIKMI